MLKDYKKPLRVYAVGNTVYYDIIETEGCCVTIDNLKCFVLLAQELNYTRAAEKAHITQTAMSRKIASIESELSAQLFTRNHHQVGLTSAGQEFYSQILPILGDYDAAVVRTQNVDKGFRDSVQIGVGVYEHALLLPVMKTFTQHYPVQKINCVQFKYRELLEEFEHDRLDVILTSDQFLHTVPKEELEMVLIHDHPWCLVLHRNNPLAEYNPVRMDLLGTQNIITMNVGSINKVRSVFQQWFHLSSIDYVNSYETKLMLVNVNRGVGFVPNFVNIDRYPEVLTRELTPLYRPRKYYAIVKKANSNPYAHQLVQILADYYQPKLWMREFGI